MAFGWPLATPQSVHSIPYNFDSFASINYNDCRRSECNPVEQMQFVWAPKRVNNCRCSHTSAASRCSWIQIECLTTLSIWQQSLTWLSAYAKWPLGRARWCGARWSHLYSNCRLTKGFYSLLLQNGFVNCDKSCPSIDDCYLLDSKSSNDTCCRKCKGKRNAIGSRRTPSPNFTLALIRLHISRSVLCERRWMERPGWTLQDVQVHRQCCHRNNTEMLFTVRR